MGNVAFVTGATRGIGKEIALELARYGYNIIGTYNSDLNGIKKLKERIERIGVQFDYYNLNLLDDDSINTFLNIYKESFESECP